MKKFLGIMALGLVLTGCGADSTADVKPVTPAVEGIDPDAETILLDEETYFNTLVMVLAFPAQYEGYEVTMYGMVDKVRYHENDGFFVGRTVVTCCLEDAEFMGLVCLSDDAGEYAQGDWVMIRGTFHYTDDNERQLIDPVITAASAPKDLYIYPS